jgi:hypothetical protein
MNTQAPAGVSRQDTVLVEYNGNAPAVDVETADGHRMVQRSRPFPVSAEAARALIAGGDFAPVNIRNEGGS